jgi:hypothetical protein
MILALPCGGFTNHTPPGWPCLRRQLQTGRTAVMLQALHANLPGLLAYIHLSRIIKPASPAFSCTVARILIGRRLQERLHRALHGDRSTKYIHRHHHRQIEPHRGNDDAVSSDTDTHAAVDTTTKTVALAVRAPFATRRQ